MIKVDLELYGVYIPGVEGPQAQFRRIEDAQEWGEFKYADRFEIQTNFAYWTTEEEQKELIEYYNGKTS